MNNLFRHMRYGFIIWTILCLLMFSTGYADVYPKEITYFEFNSHMFDKWTGYLELNIKFTYVLERDLVSIYYKSEYGMVALLLFKSSREKLLEYIEKYEEWNKKAIEKQVYLKKFMGNLDMGIYFKYGGHWHKGGSIIGKTHFLSIHKTQHQLIIKPIKAVSQENKYLIFKPDILYFTYEDVQILKKALQGDFIQQEYKRKLSEQKSVYDEFK